MSMSTGKSFLLMLAALALPVWGQAASAPRGQVAELHSCEVYAGGCVVSAESTMGGRYVLRAWHFESGRFRGVDLAGLSLALLETGSENLADHANRAESAVAYVPETASPAQHDALVAWAKQNTAALIPDGDVRAVPLQMQVAGQDVEVSVGHDISFSGGAAPDCGLTSCGESLWYEPRSTTSSFTVDLLNRARVIEPALTLRWEDHGRRTLFLGRFGDPGTSYPATGLCGAPLAETR
jgi:hypothetical protein